MITAHFIFEWLAYIIGFSYYRYLRRHTTDPVNSEQRLWIVIAAALGALIGSRGLAVLEHLNLFLQTQQHLLFLMSSKTIVGGILGGTIGVEIAKKIMGVKQSTGDLFVFPLILAMMIGRIGCFLNGLHDATIGIATALPWGYNFGDGIKRHPTSIYEILFLLALWGILLLIKHRKQLANGDLFRLFLVFYLCYRFLVAFIEPIYPIAIGLSAIQLASLSGILFYGKILFRVFIKQDLNHANT